VFLRVMKATDVGHEAENGNHDKKKALKLRKEKLEESEGENETPIMGLKIRGGQAQTEKFEGACFLFFKY